MTNDASDSPMAHTTDGREPAGAMRAARAVARMTAIDLLRRPGTWSVTLLTGILFAVLFAGMGISTSNTQERAERITFAIAADGDLAGAAKFLKDLPSDRLVIRVADDASEWVTSSRATAGLTLPEGLDGRIARGELTEVRVYYRAANNGSQEALNLLLIRFQSIELATPVDGTGTPPPGLDRLPSPVDTLVREVKQDPRVNRNQLASALAAMACILCLGTVSSVTGAFGRSQEQRTLEPMLLLPLPRRRLAAALAVGVFPVAVLQLIVALGLVLLATALPVEGLQQPLDEVARMALLGVGASVVLGALATGCGCLAGCVGVGTDDAVGLGDFFAIPFILVGVVFFLRPDLPATFGTAWVPILGPALALRDAVRGSLSLTFAGVALVATTGWVAMAIHFAGNRIASERRLLRATR